ncbi:GPI-anchored CFEM domain protein A-like [Strongylocentrotus purpuratus]|uniref:Uncharacterized protein n=1 Tax=Strongylocentrotus purpuratus TaxID=7668 RepID=A0A7M7NB14_STRPU|nr:GPI-anchored CFEM domain protein A-like [Strongylocentrotus purpuratus]
MIVTSAAVSTIALRGKPPITIGILREELECSRQTTTSAPSSSDSGSGAASGSGSRAVSGSGSRAVSGSESEVTSGSRSGVASGIGSSDPIICGGFEGSQNVTSPMHWESASPSSVVASINPDPPEPGSPT